MEEKKSKWKDFQNRLFRIISIGAIADTTSKAYDIVSVVALALNLLVSYCMTFDELNRFMPVFTWIEAITVFFFAVDFFLRLITSECLFPQIPPGHAAVKYITSFNGIIDLLSFVPYYIPVYTPTGAAAFRLLRVARIFRLFRINAYFDSLNVIGEVLMQKRQQLMSSVFLILTLMLASSLVLYGLEHDAQPDVYKNAFSGFWWAASAILTIGYGDVAPVTLAGQIVSIFICFLGVGLVAIPTGIISAGFVEQYQKLKRFSDYGVEANIRFIEIRVKPNDSWAGKEIRELGIPHGILIAAIIRGRENIIPTGSTVIMKGDHLILGAESIKSSQTIDLTEVELKRGHPWTGRAISEINISRQSFIVMLRRNGHGIIPKGNVILLEGDKLILYSNVSKAEAEAEIEGTLTDY